MIKRHFEEESGAALILITASLLVLMGVVAVVVDGGMGFSERRQAQSAVDFASLAALQEAVSCPGTCTIQASADSGAAEAIARVAGNLPGRTLDWSKGVCNDPSRPARFTVIPTTTDCVSFTSNFEESRVVLPADAIDTTFGRVIGMNSMTIRAEAEARQDLETSASVIPVTLGGAGPNVCLYSNQAPQSVPPCNGPSSGSFGYLDIALYGNTHPDVQTPSTCTDGTANVRIAVNMVLGSDHTIVEYQAGDAIVNDHLTCPQRSADINQLEVKTGSPGGGISNGLLFGISGTIDTQPLPTRDGRLECNSTSASASDQCRNIRGISLDHTGLWEYLADPTICPTAQAIETHVEMANCLSSWYPSGGVIFDESIADHPRFAAVPVFSTYPSTGTSAAYTIVEFVPVWIETIYMDCNANRCDTVHSPGEQHPTGPPACSNPIASGEWNCGWNDNSGTTAVEGLTAFKLDLDMLPLSIAEDFPGRKGIRKFALTE